MKLTIIRTDGAVYKDGFAYIKLDLSSCDIPSDVHALQWQNTTGWIEFNTNDDGTKPQNQNITELPVWANTCVSKWDEAEVARLATEENARLAAEQSPQS